MRTALLITLISMALGAPLAAQNSDLGLLVGLSPLRSQSTITSGSISTSYDANVQIDYSIQLHQAGRGSLYLEFPVAAVLHGTSHVGTSITSADGTAIFFTPGLRAKIWLQPRVSLYAAIGAGLASFGSDINTVGRTISHVSTRSTGAAMDFGAGLDFRLTRFFSIRFEGRDYVTGSNAGGFTGRNHAALDLGIGLHF